MLLRKYSAGGLQSGCMTNLAGAQYNITEFISFLEKASDIRIAETED